MPLIGFKAVFHDGVEQGHKRQTIRQGRKKAPTKRAAAVPHAAEDGHGFPPAGPGETLYLAGGVRTPHFRRLRTDTCWRVERIRLRVMRNPNTPTGTMLFDLFPDSPDSNGCYEPVLDAFARADGFTDAEAMLAWFRRVHRMKPGDPPLRGWLTIW